MKKLVDVRDFSGIIRTVQKIPIQLYYAQSTTGGRLGVIIICSAIKIPEQSYDAQYRTGGEVRCETMSNVIVKENETLDSALRRFKRSCAKAGIQQEIRKREHYEKPSVRRKKKSEAARKRKYN